MAALRRLADRFTIFALSNAYLSMLTGMFADAGLTWHGIVSGELAHAYKPDPAVYRFALDRLGLDPRRTLTRLAPERRRGSGAAHGVHPACWRG